MDFWNKREKSDFRKGFAIGAGLLGGEFASFFAKALFDESCELAHSISSNLDPAFNAIAIAFVVTTISSYGIGIWLGFKKTTHYVFGYTIGVFSVFLLFLTTLMKYAPSIVLSMIFVPASVLLGMVVKNYFENY